MEKRKKLTGKKKNKDQEPKGVKKYLKIFFTVLLSIFLMLVITGSIIATVMTIYVLNFSDADISITLDKSALSNKTTKILVKNPDYNSEDSSSSEYNVYHALSGSGLVATWVDIDEIPEHVQQAFICIEDERFRTHDGVDFKRVFGSIVHTILGSKQGGSTITQQTIKNITGDNESNGFRGMERKIKEVFRAINAEKIYTKDEILQCYLNVIPFGHNTSGIQAAANFYFGKDVTELTIAEAACLAAIPKGPSIYDPIGTDENVQYSLERRKLCLAKMLENGAIGDPEYEQAMKECENLEFTGDITYRTREDDDDKGFDFTTQGVASYFADAAIMQACNFFMEEKGIPFEKAKELLYNGGYKIYTTCDLNMQKKVEKEMQKNSNFQKSPLESDSLNAGFIAMDHHGNVKAVVGGRDEKTVDLCWNNATSSTRSPGSCIKPIASYAPALDQDIIYYSKLIKDDPIQIPDDEHEGEMMSWPVNFSEDNDEGNWSHNYLPVWKMLAKSLNTCPAQLVQKMTPAYSFNFLKEKLDITTLDSVADVNYAPVTVGGLTNGTRLEELVGAYMIFGNGGKKYDVSYISKIEDSAGNAIYEKSEEFDQVISESTAYIMNKMMQKVVTDSEGTGRRVKLNNTTLAAKTGTSSDFIDLSFVGVSPDYVSGIWIGNESMVQIETKSYQHIDEIWQNIFGDVVDSEPTKNFPDMPDSVVERRYCTKTGLLASNSCYSTEVGYYKKNNLPGVCNGH